MNFFDSSVKRNETFESFYNNPAGKAVTSINRKLTINALESNFEKLLNRFPNRKLKARVLSIDKDLYMQVFIPSETLENLFYDVVIKFINGTTYSNLMKCQIQLYSNNPNFVFTYAYAYNVTDLLIPELKLNLDKRSLTELPKIKNTELITGYDKTLFYAMFYIIKEELINTNISKKAAVKITSQRLRTLITDSKTKLIQYSKLKIERKFISGETTHSQDTTLKKKLLPKDLPEDNVLNTSNETKYKKLKTGGREKTIKKTNLDTGKSYYKSNIYNNKVDSSVDNKVDNKVNNKVDRKVKK